MFVSQIKIKEFRGIKGCKKPIKLSKLTVLIGRNNSGKSTILEALSLLPRPNSTQYPWNKDKCTFLVDLHGGASSLIYGYAGTAEIEYLINGKTWSYEISTRADITYKINGEDGDYISDADLASLLNIDKEEVSKSVFFLPFLTKDKIKELDKTIRKLKNEIVKLGANARVAKEVSKTVDDSYTEVLWEEGCLSLRKEFPDRAPLYVNLEDLGDGIKKAVRVMLFGRSHKTKAHPLG